jgi:hypothetical protein
MFAQLLAAAAATQAPTLPSFMTGCWNLIVGDHWTQECWMEPKANLMLGASREGTGDKLKSWEQLRVEIGSDGKVILWASPHGRAAIPFEAKAVSASTVEFTNATHDYPQRIRYELKGDKLDAEISLIDGSKPVRWTYVREGNASPR